jgi:DNA-binding transcriptional ArsR family regulator
LSGELLEMVAVRLRLIGDPTRICLLEMLNERDRTVTELCDGLVTSVQNVSQHLRLLYQAGIVSRCKEGNVVRYSLVDWSGWWLVEQMAMAVTDRVDELHGAFHAHEDPAARS